MLLPLGIALLPAAVVALPVIIPVVLRLVLAVVLTVLGERIPLSLVSPGGRAPGGSAWTFFLDVPSFYTDSADSVSAGGRCKVFLVGLGGRNLGQTQEHS